MMKNRYESNNLYIKRRVLEWSQWEGGSQWERGRKHELREQSGEK